MTEHIDQRDDFAEDDFANLEALIRAAGRIVQPTDDLRPRVIEAAREQRQQRRIARQLGRAAALVIALSVFLALAREPLGGGGANGQAASTALLVGDSAIGHGDREPGWALVESLTELRRRQAAILSAY